MVDLVHAGRSIVNIGREDKALQRCTLSARSMPGDGQEHRLRLVLLPSDPSSGRKATNLLNWGAAPSQAKEWNYPQAVGHMSRLVVRCRHKEGVHKLFWCKHLWRHLSPSRSQCLHFVSTSSASDTPR
jgi:hypothetical protein